MQMALSKNRYRLDANLSFLDKSVNIYESWAQLFYLRYRTKFLIHFESIAGKVTLALYRRQQAELVELSTPLRKLIEALES